VYREVLYGRFRRNERFAYEYDFHDLWRHEIRLEQILPFEPVLPYPRCTGGARATPPEDCGGPQAFLGLRQHFSLFHLAERLLTLVRQSEELDDPQAELQTLRYWLGVDRFDRRGVNRQLQQDARKLAAAGGMCSEVQL
jgi:Plasmid pRiA4b ORF-3-like protein